VVAGPHLRRLANPGQLGTASGRKPSGHARLRGWALTRRMTLNQDGVHRGFGMAVQELPRASTEPLDAKGAMAEVQLAPDAHEPVSIETGDGESQCLHRCPLVR
jgi:hypothetical protein